MRGLLASSAGATCLAALALPLSLPAGAHAAAPGAPSAPSSAPASGGTQSLPLAPLAADRALGAPGAQGLTARQVRPFALLGVVWQDPEVALHGRVQVRTRPTGKATWSAWRDVETQSREHAPDPDSAESATGRLRGGTAPLWVGRSDAVDVRVLPYGNGRRDAGRAPAPGGLGARTDSADASSDSAGTPPPSAETPLPKGLRLELIDPGSPAAPGTPRTSNPSGATGTAGATGTSGTSGTSRSDPNGAQAQAAGAQETNAPSAGRQGAGAASAGAQSAGARDTGSVAVPGVRPGATVIPARDRKHTRADLVAAGTATGTVTATSAGGKGPGPASAGRHVAPRPAIVTRKGWGADERLREAGYVYTDPVKAAFVHHTASGNDYTCAEAPEVIRAIYRYHVQSEGWRDIGYNFLVDRCGTVYEGRAGGVDKPVKGAHTMGFNNESTGVAVLGTFTDDEAPNAAVKAVAALTAWKLGLSGADPRGTTLLTSEGKNRFPKGERARLNVISGHRDGYATECPGALLYGRLGAIRSQAAQLQGR